MRFTVEMFIGNGLSVNALLNTIIINHQENIGYSKVSAWIEQ